eukprot:2298722-Rhodomonas_salina.6
MRTGEVQVRSGSEKREAGPGRSLGVWEQRLGGRALSRGQGKWSGGARSSSRAKACAMAVTVTPDSGLRVARLARRWRQQAGGSLQPASRSLLVLGLRAAVGAGA